MVLQRPVVSLSQNSHLNSSEMEELFDKDQPKKLKCTINLLKAPNVLPKNVPMSKEELIKIVAFLGEALKENCPNIHGQLCAGQNDTGGEEFFDTQGEFTQGSSSQIAEEEGKETSNKESWETVNRKVCPKYKRGECNFGAKGEGCKFQHPKKCKHFAKYGSIKFHPRGCKYDSKCKYLHPQLCKNALQAQLCLNRHCRLVHVVGTQRTVKPSQNTVNNNNVPSQSTFTAKPLPHYEHSQAQVPRVAQPHHQNQDFLDNTSLMQEIARMIDMKLAPLLGKVEALRETKRPTYSQILTQ